ncbi:MAG: recombinase RecT [Clostridiales bacterium]|nr:recombinase RecT [Clostridiales bacterium]
MNSQNKKPAKTEKPKFSVAITTKGYQNLINNTLGDPDRAKRFVATITSSVAVNPALQDCDAGTILAGGLLGESLNLSPSPQLGQFYLVPFNDRKTGTTKAQFILGYKGYLQLAMRSGQLKKINAVEVKRGELIKFDPFNEDIEVNLIEDFNERKAAPTIGYYAFFELTNGFRKAIYWSREQMMSHADTYSPAFSAAVFEKIEAGEIPEKDMWKYSSFWYKNFDDMAKKTMLRQLISKGGCPMSTEMMDAYVSDSKTFVGSEDSKTIVVDNEEPEVIEHAVDDYEAVPEEQTEFDFEEIQ